MCRSSHMPFPWGVAHPERNHSVTTSRIPGFRHLSVEERRAVVAEQDGVDA